MSAIDLSGRVILVTGASRGIGYFAAEHLASLGAHIIALARTQGGLEDLDDAITKAGGEATLVPMDLKNSDGIDQLGKIIFDRWGRLDGLLSCGAVLGEITPTPQIVPKTWANVMDVNVTANYRLIRSMDPLLRSSDAGRAVFVSSSVAHSRKPFWGAYGASKAAMEALVLAWANEQSESSPLKINIVDPGRTRTAMRAKAMPGENPETLIHPRELAPKFATLFDPKCDKQGELIKFQP